ncbi:MAG: trypsin-like peptidase domain-containing protein [Longimicrobiales bacterium]
MAQLQEVREALAEARRELLSKPNVVAVGVGRKITAGRTTAELALVASVVAKQPETRLAAADRVPARVSGLPTDVVVTGPIFALQSRTDRVRPAPGGVSIGHFAITAGTLGCLVRKDGELRILSNNHVLANSNDAEPGDPIIQPGAADGGSDPADRIGRLSEFVPIEFDELGSDCPVGNAVAGTLNTMASAVGSDTRLRPVRPVQTENLVDCALAEPLDPADVIPEILEIGTVAGLAEGTLDLAIQKSGRTTGHTTGTIQQVDVTVRVSYGVGRSATFVDQLMAGAMSQGGDSGSVVLDMDNNLVGLLFAGSTNSTIINRIQNVFQLLDVALP